MGIGIGNMYSDGPFIFQNNGSASAKVWGPLTATGEGYFVANPPHVFRGSGTWTATATVVVNSTGGIALAFTLGSVSPPTP